MRTPRPTPSWANPHNPTQQLFLFRLCKNYSSFFLNIRILYIYKLWISDLLAFLCSLFIYNMYFLYNMSLVLFLFRSFARLQPQQHTLRRNVRVDGWMAGWLARWLTVESNLIMKCAFVCHSWIAALSPVSSSSIFVIEFSFKSI